MQGTISLAEANNAVSLVVSSAALQPRQIFVSFTQRGSAGAAPVIERGPVGEVLHSARIFPLAPLSMPVGKSKRRRVVVVQGRGIVEIALPRLEIPG